jgi:hypothetical protein
MAGNSHFCHGWLSMFKKQTLQMSCTDFTGKVTNCWDVIGVIQIHAYAKTAAEVKSKIASYYTEFTEDFEGVVPIFLLVRKEGREGRKDAPRNRTSFFPPTELLTTYVCRPRGLCSKVEIHVHRKAA